MLKNSRNFGGVLREGRYINRDATMLNLIGVSEDNEKRSIPVIVIDHVDEKPVE